MVSLRYYLVLVLLALGTVACLIGVTAYGFSVAGLAAGVGTLLCVALFFSYGMTMRSRHAPINR